MKLENWSIVVMGTDPYQAPECQTACLHGNVYGHPKFKDGDAINTSAIKRKVGELIETYSGSQYELGEIDQEYEKLYPNARERMFKSLNE